MKTTISKTETKWEIMCRWTGLLSKYVVRMERKVK